MAYRSFCGGSGRLDTHLDTPPSINRRHPVSCLAHQGASAIDRAIQISPTTTHPNVRLVDVPASADFAFSSPTQVLSRCWGKFGFPIPPGVIAEDEPADQEHFGQIS